MSYTLILTASVFAGLFIIIKLSKKILFGIAKRKQVPEKRIYYINRFFNLFYIITALFTIAFVWSVDIEGLSLIASSVFAIIGVALFAQWSILSNVTASIIIFFTFPAKVGDRVRILAGDNTVEGRVREIALFQIEIIDDDGNIILFPNNLLLQNPVVKILSNKKQKNSPKGDYQI